MFELTDTLTYAVPVMLSVLVAKTIADALEPKGIYDLVIELSQLPYLDAKHEYVWGSLQISDVVRPSLAAPSRAVFKALTLPLLRQTDRDVEVLRVDSENTVKSIRDQLQALVEAGSSDSGFPILRPDGEGTRMVGYIGANELEHALSEYSPPCPMRTGVKRPQASSRTNRTRSLSSTQMRRIMAVRWQARFPRSRSRA